MLTSMPKTNEKLYTMLPEEFGSLAGKLLVFDKGLYGLRSSGARFHEHLSDILRKLDFVPSKADPNFRLKIARLIMTTLQDMCMTC